MTNNRIIYYYQTFCGLSDVLNSTSPLSVSHIYVASIHFGTNDDGSPYIHLNNHSPDDSTFDTVWKELQLAHNMGIKIMVMMGGAGGAYQNLFSNFDVYYSLLKKMIQTHTMICGIDLDIEESVNLDNVKMLIQQLDQDFGHDFIITMAPLSSSLSSDEYPGMGGFKYKELYKTEIGQRINWFNGQFYGNYTADEYDAIINNGYDSSKIVMGMLSGNYDPTSFGSALDEIKKCSTKYLKNFGGVFVWEYNDCPPDPKNHYKWAQLMASNM